MEKSVSSSSSSKKMTSRDAVMVGALGALIIAIRFVFMLLGGLSPYAWFSSHFIDAILIGPIFMLIMSKVRKPGAFLIIAVITGFVFLAATWMIVATGIIGGLLCEFFVKRANYRPGFLATMGFLCFNLGFLGDFLPLYITRDEYYAASMSTMPPAYVDALYQLVTPETLIAIIASIVVGSILGALFGSRMMRRHFN